MSTPGKMIYNKITLAFPEKEERLFLEKYFFDSLIQFRVSFVLVTIIYGIFGYLDTLMFPEFAKIFHTIRYVFVVPILLVVFLLSFTKVFQKIWQVLLLISFIIGGSGISIMTMLVPENYAYYAGMMLIFSAGYFFIKLRFFLASIAGWTTLLVFNAGAIFYSHAPHIILINTNFFFISANIIGMFAAYNIEFYARRNFILNYELDTEKLLVEKINKNLERTVEERTNELLQAKEAAETNNANVTAIIEGTQSNIWAFDRNYEILYINHVFQTEFKQTFGVWLTPGISLIESLPNALRPLWKSRYDRVLNNEPFTIEDAFDTGNGMIYIHVSFNPIIKKGEVVGGSCFGSNITDRKLSEIELQRAKERAEESDRLKSAFLANMSHEIRTPMNGILGFAELLKEPDLSGNQQKEYVEIIEKSGARMLNIINDIIDISKIESGQIKVSIAETNINDQFKFIAAFFKPEAEQKGIELICNKSLPAEDAIVKTDREKVYAILTNLIKNALKFTHKGFIEFGCNVETRHALSLLKFYVKDTGVGINPEKQKIIFERFRQEDESRTRSYEGAGLGLSISTAYIEMLGGKIWVESEQGIGSTFYFTLPYNTGQERIVIQKKLPDDNLVSVFTSEVPRLKVLIAEDDEASEKLLGIEIRKVSKEILKVRTGLEAVVAFRDNQNIDLILMDIQMPEMDGYEATRQIRQINKDVVIIAQTAFGLSGDREKAIEAGCNDYISKPISNVELRSLIQKYFKK